MPRYRDVEISLFNRKPNSTEMGCVKQTCTIIIDEFHDGSPVRSEEEQAESFIDKIYGWSKGLHYSHLSVKTIKEHNKMAKTTKTEQTTELAVFEEKAKAITLPEIPKVMNIGGLEFSEAEIEKAVKEVKKIKVDVPKPDDTVKVAEEKRKVYEQLVEKKNQFVKTRTAPDKFRTEITKPINDWTKKLKAQTDSFGNIAKQGQEHCEAEIFIWENWEAEQERIKQEATQKLVNARTVDLQNVAGILNPQSLHWTFEHAPSKIVENMFLESADDSEWNGLMKDLEDSFEADKEKKIKEKADFEAAKNAVFNTRLQMLQLVGGYDNPATGVYTKNGHTLSEDQIRNTPEIEWLPLVMSHNEALANPFNNVSPVSQETASVSNDPITSNPFAQFAKPAEVETTAEATGTVASPFDVSSQDAVSEPVEESVKTLWPVPFVEKELGKTVLRIFPVDNQGLAMEGIHDVKFDGSWDNGLMFIIYAK